MYDVYVYRIELPGNIHEMVVPNSDDDGFTIYIDSRLSDNQAEAAYQHALGHITNNDFSKMSVQEIEHTAHQLEAVKIPAVAQQEAHGDAQTVHPTNSTPIAKRTRKRRKRYDETYWRDYHTFLDNCFSEREKWRIAENQYLYKGL